MIFKKSGRDIDNSNDQINNLNQYEKKNTYIYRQPINRKGIFFESMDRTLGKMTKINQYHIEHVF